MARRLDDIRNILIVDGINSSLVYLMTDEELRISDMIADYNEYSDYMDRLARKYNI